MKDIVYVEFHRNLLKGAVHKIYIDKLAADYAKERFWEDTQISTLDFLVQKTDSFIKQVNSDMKQLEDLLEKLVKLSHDCQNILLNSIPLLTISSTVGEGNPKQAIRSFLKPVSALYSGLCDLNLGYC